MSRYGEVLDATVSGIDVSGKRALRRELLAVRARLTAEDVGGDGRGSRATAPWSCPSWREARTVAAYVSVGREPGTRALLDALRARGVRVLLPVLLPDNDLDWGVYEGAEHLVRAGARACWSRTARGWARTR